MYLVIDAGNTRTKYGCHDGRQWLAQEVLVEDVFELPSGFVPQRIIVSSVVGAARDAVLQRALAPWAGSVEWLRASSERCGLHCAYEDPAKLGPDRWAAAIAAWLRVRSACLVVSVGTATTIDVVSAAGVFEGGCILPGLSMMFEALASGTFNLPLAQGQLQIPARNTHDAIHTGCLLAHLGAVKELAAQLPVSSPILLTGGAADYLLPLLGDRACFEPWLVLDGLLAVACNSV